MHDNYLRNLSLCCLVGLSLCACGSDPGEGSGATDTETTTESTGGSDTDPTTAGPTTNGTSPTGSESDSDTGIVTTDPPTTDPSTTDPSTTDPSTTDPSTTDPSTTDPSTTDPSTTDPTDTTDSDTTDSDTGMGGGCEGLGDQGLLLHSTLDDAGAVMNPAVGAGMGQVFTMPADDFVPGLDGDAVYIDAGAEFIRFPQRANGNDNINFEQGTIDFCYRPDYDHTDGENHALFEARGSNMSGGGFIRVRKAAQNNANSFQVLFLEAGNMATFGELAIDANDYAWTAGEWVRVTVSWDFTVGGNEQNLRAYLDGVELIDPDPPLGPQNMPSPGNMGNIFVGFFNMNDWPASGAIDDFKLYDSALAP